MAIKDLAITSLETINVFTLGGDYLFTLDELQNATISQGEERVDITGKQGRKITSFKRNKSVTISGTNGIVSAGLLDMQTGNNGEGWKSGAATIMWTDTTLKVTKNTGGTPSYTAELKYTPNSVADDDGHIEIFAKNEDGTLGKKVEFDATLARGKFTLTENKVTFYPGSGTGDDKDPDFEDGQELVAYYKRTVSAADKLENMSDGYAEKTQVYIDAIAEDKCGNTYHVQYHIPKGDFSGEFEFSMGDDQTVQAFEIEALAGGCSGSSAFWTLTVFGKGN